MALKVVPPPASLPSDQMTTEAWFLSRWTMFWARTTHASVHSGWPLPGYSSRMPWVSRLVSSTRYRPYSSASSSHSGLLG